MTPEQCSQAAAAITNARKTGAMLEGIGDLTPRDMGEAYTLQDAFIGSWDDSIVGWKVGATALKVQDIYNVDEPFCGPFYRATTYQSPARPKADDYGHMCIESEFAFRFSKPLPPRDAPYTRDEILDAVDAVMPAFELISPRFDSLLQDRAPLATADCGLNGGFVLGEANGHWRDIDYENHKVTLRIDGEVAAEGTGANVLGHPFNVLDWFVNKHSALGRTLDAGMIVSTGTCTGFLYIEKGQEAVADYGALGEISVTFV